MTWGAAFTSGDGTPDAIRPPAQCTCTRVIVPTLTETLGCPRDWWQLPGGQWVHAWPLRRRGSRRRKTVLEHTGGLT